MHFCAASQKSCLHFTLGECFGHKAGKTSEVSKAVELIVLMIDALMHMWNWAGLWLHVRALNSRTVLFTLANLDLDVAAS